MNDHQMRNQQAGLVSDGIDAALLARVRRARLRRLQAELMQRDIAAVVLVDPVNVRYATDTRNMQIFSARNPARYVFVGAEGPVVLFDFAGCEHLAQDNELIDEIRTATTASYVAAASHLDTVTQRWADEIHRLTRGLGSGSKRLGVERFNARAAFALAELGYEIVDAQEPVERARARKDHDEIALVRASVRATERGVARIRDALHPGISENELWAHLHRSVIEQNGDYVETRLLSSGPRTNPWFQECSPRTIEAGDLVALDTDVVGCFGYYADFSRTFLCGEGKASNEQRTLYRLAHEQVHTNIAGLKPGMTFREYSETAWRIPERYFKHRYYLLAHGVGMTGEYPYLLHWPDFAEHGYDGLIEPGMTLCIESFIGSESGREGVKLEQQVLVTESGVELLSNFPFDERLLSSEH